MSFHFPLRPIVVCALMGTASLACAAEPSADMKAVLDKLADNERRFLT